MMAAFILRWTVLNLRVLLIFVFVVTKNNKVHVFLTGFIFVVYYVKSNLRNACVAYSLTCSISLLLSQLSELFHMFDPGLSSVTF